MTRDEARKYASAWCEPFETAWYFGVMTFIQELYNNNMEIVDRTIDEDTARNLDNELSGGE